MEYKITVAQIDGVHMFTACNIHDGQQAKFVFAELCEKFPTCYVELVKWETLGWPIERREP